MKQKRVPFACMAILLLLVFAGVFYACRNTDFEANPANPASAETQSSKLISYDQFLKEMQGWKDQSYYRHFRTGAAGQRTTESPLAFHPTPSERDSVRRISINSHTTYTIVSKPMSPLTPIFHNIVIDSSEAGVNTLLLTYLPEDNWVEETKRGRKPDFFGKVVATEYEPLFRGDNSGRVTQAPICTSVMVLSQMVEHLCCHNQQAHANCNCPANKKYYIEYLYNEVTTCIDVDIPPFGGTSGPGTGGGTIPNPGGGYDPCTGTGLRTETNPCNPNNPTTPQPENPNVVPNSAVSSLITVASSKGVTFNQAEIILLNSLSAAMIGKIAEVIKSFGNAVISDFLNLMKAITGEKMPDVENSTLNALGSNLIPNITVIRLMYAANAYAAQSATAAKYSVCGSKCASCKANAFKHALYLIFNAEVFGINAAVVLANAHEDNMSDPESLMDKKNNAAGQKIFNDYSGAGSPNDWIQRVKVSVDQGLNGMVFIKSGATVSTLQLDTFCP